jgi:hypothetical protein
MGLASGATLGTFKLNSCIDLMQTCGNCSFVNITSISYPNGTKINHNFAMIKNGVDYSYNFCNNTQLGEYIYNTLGNPDGVYVTQPVSYLITNTGEKPAGDGLIIFIYSLFIFLTMALSFTFLINIAKLATFTATLFDLAISWGFYFITVITLFISNSYMQNNLISDNILLIISITGFTNFILPAISFIVSFFVNITKKKRMLDVHEISGLPGRFR